MAYLKFNIGDSKDVEFHKYNKGKPVEGKFGPQFMYGVRVGGEEVTWYTTPNNNAILQENNLQVGDVVKVTRAAEKQYVFTRNGEVLMRKEDVPIQRTQQSEPTRIGGETINERMTKLEKRVELLESIHKGASINF